jgi:hypothetical protein
MDAAAPVRRAHCAAYRWCRSAGLGAARDFLHVDRHAERLAGKGQRHHVGALLRRAFSVDFATAAGRDHAQLVDLQQVGEVFAQRDMT